MDESFLEFWVWVVSPSPEKYEVFLYFAPAPLPSSSTVGGEESSPEKRIRMGEKGKNGRRGMEEGRS